MISEHLPVFIDLPQNVVLIEFFIDEFPDAETKRRSGRRRNERRERSGDKGGGVKKVF